MRYNQYAQDQVEPIFILIYVCSISFISYLPSSWLKKFWSFKSHHLPIAFLVSADESGNKLGAFYSQLINEREVICQFLGFQLQILKYLCTFSKRLFDLSICGILPLIDVPNFGIGIP